MPFLAFVPAFIVLEEFIQVTMAVGAIVVGARAAVEVTNTAIDVVQDLNRDSRPASTSTYVEKKAIGDWGCNGLDTDERKILLEHGYSDRVGFFTLEELKSASERMYAEKAPGKPTEKDGFTPDRHKGDKLVKNPNGQGKGGLDKKGEVGVPTWDDGHGGAHWDVQNPRTGGHRDVYPNGRTRYH